MTGFRSGVSAASLGFWSLESLSFFEDLGWVVRLLLLTQFYLPPRAPWKLQLTASRLRRVPTKNPRHAGFYLDFLISTLDSGNSYCAKDGKCSSYYVFLHSSGFPWETTGGSALYHWAVLWLIINLSLLALIPVLAG